MIIITTIVIVILIVCTKFLKLQRYWKTRDVRHVKPWPFVGYMAPNIFRRKSFADIVQGLYNTFPEQRYFGCYQFLTPILMIRDPDLIKEIVIDHFDSFPQRKNFIDVDADPIWAKNLYAMKGDVEWHSMRATMSPMFTNSNLNNTFGLIKECAKAATQFYQKNDSVTKVDVSNVASRFANDVTASAVFGVTNCNSIEDPNAEFYRVTQEVTKTSATKQLKFFVYTIWPRLAKFLGFRVFKQAHAEYYREIVKSIITQRMQERTVRPDMIQLIVEASQNSLDSKNDGSTADKTIITDGDPVSQAISFLLGGFDAVSSTISHLVYELALNCNIQTQLRDEVLREGDNITYENLLKMQYLDMVVAETLRKWPTNPVIDRECTTTFTLDPKRDWERSIEIEPSTLCAFPIYAIHRDPKLYEVPNKFDPERFNEENSFKIKPFTYLPFGAGPRGCIGSRFATLQIKAFVFFLISAFEIVRVKETKDEPKMSKTSINLVFQDGFWVGLQRRQL